MMNQNLYFVGILLLFMTVGCKQSRSNENPVKSEIQVPKPVPLIEAMSLQSEINSDDVVLIDFRKKQSYEKGHLPNAINMWRTDIESAAFPYKGMMASKKEIEQLFSKRGIHMQNKLVIYDDNGSCDAARLWWVLSSYGFKNMQLLNGGLQSWRSAGGSISNEIVARETTVFKLPVQNEPQQYINKEALRKGLNNGGNWLVLDTRTHDEFSGKRKKKGAKKAGRIIKSAFIDWSSAVNLTSNMRFKSKNELESIYGKLIKSKNDTIITYCHTGVRSAHTTFVLQELLGYQNVRNYDGSWTEWSHFDDYPSEKDSLTVILQ